MAGSGGDMRCGFDRLAERVKALIGQDPMENSLFVFRSRRGDRLKILTWVLLATCFGLIRTFGEPRKALS
jgi:transposase